MSRGLSANVQIEEGTRGIVVRAPSYRWTWDPGSDELVISDPRGRQIAAGPVQPAVVVTPDLRGDGRLRPGSVRSAVISGNLLTITWTGVNGTGQLEVTLAFDDETFTLGDLRYSSPEAASVERVVYFAAWEDGVPVPGLRTEYVVQPGVAVSSSLSPVVPTILRLRMRSWLGRGGFDDKGTTFQQWALPVHYFGGFSYTGRPEHKGAAIEAKSDSFCAGLTDLPVGDLHMQYRGDCISPTLSLHGDKWPGFEAGPSGIRLGAPFLWAFGGDYRQAIEAYYRSVVERGAVRVSRHSERKSELLGMSQFNTWGAQMAERAHAVFLTQASLEQIYDDMRAAGMRPGIFVIDDKWEGEYGLLRHDERRFPDFHGFLDRVRGDGMAIGMWAAFLRCDRPESHGLTVDDMLADRHGEPIVMGNSDWGAIPYYLFDASRPAVQEVLRRRARTFMATYRPDLIKFDFGYEIPSLATTAPHDRAWAGETFLRNTLEVIVSALREVNPDVVVMYYCLSPLFTDFVDQHSTDDMWPSLGEYEVELNRRVFFSSLLGIVGVSSYGSGGYDWANIRDIWFDSIASGAIGSLGSFRGDQSNRTPTRDDMATFAGLSAIARPTRGAFTIDTKGTRIHPGSTTAHARSWIRTESGEVVLAALRPERRSGVAAPERVGSLVETDTDVVVASLGDGGLATSARIGVVPYGGGTLRIARARATRASAVAHRFGAEDVGITPTWDGTVLVIELAPDTEGHPWEWIELRLAEATSA